MKKWFARYYLPVLVLILTAGVLKLVVFGLEPGTVLVMKPSFFDAPEEIGEAIFRRFYWPVEEKKRVVVGVPPQPDWYRGVVKGFLLGAVHQQKPFDVIIAEEQMPDLDLSGLPTTEVVKVVTSGDIQSSVIDALKKAESEGKRALVYLPSVFSTHLLPGNTIARIEKDLGSTLFAITVGPLALRFDQEYLIDPPCVGSERDTNGTAALGCSLLKSGRKYYRKKIEQSRWVAIMDSPKPDDFLLMVSSPGQGADAKEANHSLRMDAPPAAH